jgi:hypothetical protein
MKGYEEAQRFYDNMEPDEEFEEVEEVEEIEDIEEEDITEYLKIFLPKCT